MPIIVYLCTKLFLCEKDSCNNYNEKEAYIHVLVKQLVALHSFSSEGIEEDRCQGVYRLQLHICRGVEFSMRLIELAL